MNDQTATDKIINRHMARLLYNLEQANCPAVYIGAVKSAFSWLRSDLKDPQEQSKKITSTNAANMIQ